MSEICSMFSLVPKLVKDSVACRERKIELRWEKYSLYETGIRITRV